MIIILGGSGFIGTAFRQCLDRRSVDYLSVSRSECNYGDAAQLAGLLRETRPRFLINAAGFTGRRNVDDCELDRTACLFANGVLPGIVRDVCERLQIPWGHVSSGCIYQGSRPDGRGYRESDRPNFTFRQNNCSFYAGCKALGEELLQDAGRCYIWRPRMPFSDVDGAKNYLSKLMRYDRLLDVRNSLSYVDDFINACVDCILRECEFGTYNLTNTSSLTTREVVELIERAKICRKNFRFFDSEQEFYDTTGCVPRSSCVLDNEKASGAGLSLMNVDEAIERSLANWKTDKSPSLV